MNKGKLYLIPSPLGENDPAEVIPAPVLERLSSIDCYVVEEVRTARRYLSRAGLKGHIEGLEFHELNEHTPLSEIAPLVHLFENGRDVGLISEAGLPAVADPGAQLVGLCHREGIEVVPLVGPSSLMLALMASGLNGQSFAFVGYIPAKTEERRAAIKRLEKRSAAEHQTQILIETPYRNDALLSDLAATCSGKTLITVAANLTQPDAFIRTQTAARWKEHPVTIGKRPCVFLILA
ncbi:MAG: SAM-dependent methyltransferase [Bacteroidales bacterium]|nr:SAM-dependent methyltransferase [Bacteroidales bacterium]